VSTHEISGHVDKSPVTTGNRAFAESNNLWRDHTLGLSAKSSRQRPQLLGVNSSLRGNRLALSEEFLHESIFLALSEEILKKSLFHLQTFFIINIHLYKVYVKI
jgi:hypothetical protein